MARVKSVLGRSHRNRACAGSKSRVEIGHTRREVSWRSTPFELDGDPVRVLRVLMGSPGRVFSRDELLNQVWGYDYSATPAP